MYMGVSKGVHVLNLWRKRQENTTRQMIAPGGSKSGRAEVAFMNVTHAGRAPRRAPLQIVQKSAFETHRRLVLSACFRVVWGLPAAGKPPSLRPYESLGDHQHGLWKVGFARS